MKFKDEIFEKFIAAHEHTVCRCPPEPCLTIQINVETHHNYSS